jgi:hypothetical protein
MQVGVDSFAAAFDENSRSAFASDAIGARIVPALYQADAVG